MSVDSVAVPLSQIRKGDIIVINNAPCKILEMEKYGEGYQIKGEDVLFKKINETLVEVDGIVRQALVSNLTYTVADISDGSLSVMNEEGGEGPDFRFPADEELAKAIEDAFNEGKTVKVNTLSWQGQREIVSFEAE
eukprot:TRINITY_DN9016_c0_g1_i1.p1 TRINITY_DN9016_c0_g1~~TRINITY_DN9016_c0_g1_i1.p1  ORF type:complete len:136 (-),score=30.57 TRINITY_DN9016_c0_g1_i1:53-460(-)